MSLRCAPLVAAATLLAACSRPAPPSVPLPPPSEPRIHDAGSVAQGVPVRHAFQIHNPLATPARLLRVECNAPGMTARFKPVLAPHSSGTIELTWETARVEGDFEVSAVASLEGAQPPLTLVLRARVIPPLEVQPARITHFSVHQGETGTRRLRIIRHDGAPLALHALEVQGSHFTATPAGAVAKNVLELDLTVPADASPGRFQEALVLHTNHPEVPTLRLPVRVLVKESLHANPEAVDFGQVSLQQLEARQALGELLTQTLMLRKRDGEFAITSITTDVPLLRIAHAPSGSSAAFRLDVGLSTEKLTPGPIRGFIHIRTTDDARPVLTLPVRGTVG